MAHVIVLDSVYDDIFVCGLCKAVFNALNLFLDHKRSSCPHRNIQCVLTNNIVFSNGSPNANVSTLSSTNPNENVSFSNPNEDILITVPHDPQELSAELPSVAADVEHCNAACANDIIYSIDTPYENVSSLTARSPKEGIFTNPSESILTTNSNEDILITDPNASQELPTELPSVAANVEYMCTNDIVYSNEIPYENGLTLSATNPNEGIIITVPNDSQELSTELSSVAANVEYTRTAPCTNNIVYPNENNSTLPATDTSEDMLVTVPNEPQVLPTELPSMAANAHYSKTNVIVYPNKNNLNCSATKPIEDNLKAVPNGPKELSKELPSATAVVGNTCTVCGKSFKRKTGLLAHIRSHNMKPHQCLICGRCFSQPSGSERHLLSHKVWPESISESTCKNPDEDLLSYSCQYCPSNFANFNLFRTHLTTKHKSVKKFKCIQGVCNEFYDTVELLLRHVSSNHIKQLYVCHICCKQFNSLESIAAHDITHLEPVGNDKLTRECKCDQCDAVFTTPEKLSLHMYAENHKKACIHCKKTFSSDKRLRLHLQIHRNMKPFQCNVCDKGFHVKKYLASHMLKHGYREYKCTICSGQFNRSDILRRHMKTHSSIIRKYQCPFRTSLNCMKEFTRKDKMSHHLKIHNPKLIDSNVYKQV